MRRYDVMTEICDAMLTLGWKPYQNDHEDANGQFEMNWEYRRCAADRRPPCLLQVHGDGRSPRSTGCAQHSCRSLSATLTGNGCHAHVSVWDKTGKKNLFHDPTRRAGPVEAGLPVPRRRDAFDRRAVRFFNPTVNSYKRINAPRTTSGATWAPNTITYSAATTGPT